MKYVVLFSFVCLSGLMGCLRDRGAPDGVGPEPIARVDISPGEANLASLGRQLQLHATARGRSGAELEVQSFAWTTSDSSVVTVSAVGLVTARGDGAATVRASVDGVIGEARIEVDQVPVGLTLRADTTTFTFLGQHATLDAVVTDSGGSSIHGLPVKWTSTDSAVVGVDSEGRVTATSNGSATIRAEYAGLVDSVGVSVAQRVGRVVVTPSFTILRALGATALLTASATDAGGSEVSSHPVTWSSSNTSSVVVDERGLITAMGTGTATIRAESDGVTDSATVGVERVVQEITIPRDTVTLATVGDTFRISAEIYDPAGGPIHDVPLTYSSSDTLVAEVSGDGLVAAVGFGTAVVRADVDPVEARSPGPSRAAPAPTLADSVLVTVPFPVASVAVTPHDVGFGNPPAHLTLVATAYDAAGDTVPGVLFTWSSSAPSVVVVDSAGHISAVGNGSAFVRASVGAVADSARVSVGGAGGGGGAGAGHTPAVATIVVAPTDTALTALGQTTRLFAQAFGATGTLVTGTAFSWLSSDPTVVTVTSNGTITAVGNGTAQIQAWSDGKFGSANVTVRQAVDSVAVSPNSTTVAALGQTVGLSAAAFDANGNPIVGASFIWRSLDPSVATVASDGTVTAVGNGAVQIRANSGGAAAFAAVTVAQVVDSVAVTPDPTTLTALGQTAALSPAAFDANGNTVAGASFTWQSTDSAVAAVAADGTVTAVGNGATQILATSSGVSGLAAVTVEQVAHSVSVDRQGVTFTALTDTLTLSASAYDVNGNPINRPPSWSSDRPSVASITPRGLLASVGNGEARVSATVQGAADTILVTVSQMVDNVDVVPDSASVFSTGGTEEFTAVARDSLGVEVADAAFTWSSSNEAVAIVDASGLVTAVSDGVAYISAASRERRDSATAVVSAVEAVSVTPASSSLVSIGQTTGVAAEAYDALGTALPGAPFTWSSSDESVATVDRSGTVTAVADGTTEISASAGGVSNSASITVQQVPDSVSISPRSLTLVSLGATADLSAEALDAGGTPILSATFTWSSLDPSVATVSSTGEVTAQENGTTTVTARSGAASDSVIVTVAQTVASIAVSPDTLVVSVGSDSLLVARALDAGGSTVSGIPIAWSTSAPGTVSTDAGSGRVTGVSEGFATISATGAGAVGRAVVRSIFSGWPDEPAGLSKVASNEWTGPLGPSSGPAGTWQHLDRRAESRIVSDSTAPFSPPSVLEDVYPTGFPGGSEPATDFIFKAFPGIKEIFVGTWWKANANWEGHPTGINKLLFLWPTLNTNAVMTMYGPPGGPYDLSVALQWPGYSQAPYFVPNRGNGRVVPGIWHRIEWYLKFNTAQPDGTPNQDGIIRWWVDGELAGEYTSIVFPAGHDCDSEDFQGFCELEIAPTWGGVGGTKSQVDFYRFDDMYVSGR